MAENFHPTFKVVKTSKECAEFINRPHEDFPAFVQPTHDVLNIMIDCNYNEISSFIAKTIHSSIFSNEHDQITVGDWRRWNVTIGNFIPPHPIEILRFLPLIFPLVDGKNLIEWYRKFQSIHPFDDGNGRVGGVIVAVMNKIHNGEWLAPMQ